MSLKVVCVVDKTGTALDRLAKGVAKYHDNLNYIVCDVHPKRPDPQQLAKFEREAIDADIIDAQYYRSLYMLRDRYPWLKEKKTILTHNNPYAIEEQDWSDVDINVANNLTIQKRLSEITPKPVEYIPLVADSDFWKYNHNWEKTDRILMVANRIESKKGILPVAIACAELGLKFVLVGNISDMAYIEAIYQTGALEFHENVSDEKLRELYYSSAMHVCNSVDNFESGTLPILEAMLCGTPVLTRSVGHVPDLYNKENMALLNNSPDNVVYIRERLQSLYFDTDKLESLRRAGWETAKTRNFERRAYAYQKLYRKLQANDKPVSIVVPVCDKPDITRRCLDAIAKQRYQNIEVIMVDDTKELPSPNREVYDNIKHLLNFPIRYIYNPITNPDPVPGYGLAAARNKGIIEATGEIIVFCDQRVIMEPNAITELVKQCQTNMWVYGDKNGKTTFVENFSAVNRSDIIKAGMFNERMDRYGGMSQEIRSRINRQGMITKLVPSAKATQAGKSRNKWTKQDDIIKIKNTLWKCDLT